MVRITGFETAARRFEELSNDMGEMSAVIDHVEDDTAAEVAEEVTKSAKRFAPVRSGKLRESIRSRKLGQGIYQVYTDVEYAYAIEYGLPPRSVFPRTKEWMKFEWHGDIVYAKRVDIGHVDAQPFMRPAVMENREVARRIAGSKMANWMERVFNNRPATRGVRER